MIVRILGEGQFNLPGAAIDDLNDIDNRLVEAVETEDEESFRSPAARNDLAGQEKGSSLPLDELVESDLILPETDLTLAEAEHIFIGMACFQARRHRFQGPEPGQDAIASAFYLLTFLRRYDRGGMLQAPLYG